MSPCTYNNLLVLGHDHAPVTVTRGRINAIIRPVASEHLLAQFNLSTVSSCGNIAFVFSFEMLNHSFVFIPHL